MEISDIPITGILGADLKWEPQWIYPVSDIHVGSGMTDERGFRQYIEEGLDRKALFIGGGDYGDLASPSNRKSWVKAGFYDSVERAMDEITTQQERRILHLLRGTEDHWCGLVRGHHTWRHLDNTSTEARLAKALRTRHLGTCGNAILRFERGGKSHNVLRYVIWLHHSRGGGVKLAAGLNQLENLASSFDADAYLTFHRHRMTPAKKPVLGPSRTRPYKVIEHTKLLICSGGWTRGYQQGVEGDLEPQDTYVERGMMTPTTIGGVPFKITPRHHHGYDDFDVKIEF